MKAYVSLHTDAPHDQLDHEVFYKGYSRVEFDYEEGCFSGRVLKIVFPEVLADSGHRATYAAVGARAEGQGEIFVRTALDAGGQRLDPAALREEHPEVLSPDFWRSHGVPEDQLKATIDGWQHLCPTIRLTSTAPASYPAHLNPIARVARQLVDNNLMRTDELHPKLFEAINDALQNAGAPILLVTRAAAATMQGDMSKLRLSTWGNA